MKIVNLLTQIFSGAIFLFVVYQIFVSNKGSVRHILMGKTLMILGILIFVLITIRGFARTGPMTSGYFLHLLTGFPFFFVFFMTGYTGFQARKKTRFIRIHRRYAYTTFIFLLITLIVGIYATWQHQQLDKAKNISFTQLKK